MESIQALKNKTQGMELTDEQEAHLWRVFRDTGDPEAIHRLVLANMRVAFTAVKGIPHFAIEDALSTASVGLTTAARKWDLQKSSFRHYAKYWARGGVLRMVQKGVKGNCLALEELEEDLTPSTSEDLSDEVLAKSRELSEPLRRVIELRMKNYSLHEVGSELGISANAVHLREKQAVARMRGEWEEMNALHLAKRRESNAKV